MWAPDLPGHGRGPRLGAYSHTVLLDFIEQFIDENEINEASIVGHSHGGHLAIDLLERDLNFVVNKIALIGTPPLKMPFDSSAFIEHPVMPLVHKEELTEEEYLQMAMSFGEEEFKALIRHTDPKFRSGIVTSLQAGLYPDEFKILSAFEGDTACFVGELDPLVNKDYIRQLGLNFWQDELIMIPEAGHTPQYDAPQEFNTLLYQFLND